MKLLRSLLIWFIAIHITVFWGIVSIIGSLFDTSGTFCHRCMRMWAKALLKVGGVKLKIEGERISTPEEGVIIVSNHCGAVDILVLAASVPFKFGWVAKKELFKIPFLGWHMRRCGYVAVDRRSREGGMRALEEAALKVKEGNSLLFFPEGTRSKDGTLKRFKKGAFELSLKTGRPVLPVALKGTAAVLPKGGFTLNKGAVTVQFGKLLYPADFEDRESFAVRAREEIFEMLKT